MIIKDHIKIIEKYTTYKNLYEFLLNDKKLVYKCDLCKCEITNITKKNKIIYEIHHFNNNLLKFQNRFIKLNLEELLTINTINYYDIKFEETNLIFCNLCMFNVNKKSNINNVNILFDYISNDFYNYIIMNNMYFIKDSSINNKNTSIKRIIFHKKKDSLFLKYIYIDNLLELNLNKLTKNNYEILNNIIKNDFNFDMNYLKDYLKIKYD